MSETGDPCAKGMLELKLNNIATYMTKIGQRSEGPRQQVAGIEWYIRAYPQVVDNATYLTCYLVGETANKWTAWVDATFRIVKKHGGGFGNQCSMRKQLMGKGAPGWKEFISSEELLNAANGFVLDDSVEIRANFSVTDVCGASFNVFETVGALATDIKLRVGDSVFYANKGYLSVVSAVFRDMFALTESKDEMKEIDLKDLDAGEFREFLRVIYPTRYPITDTNVVRMFRIADRFGVKRLIADCEHYLFDANGVPWFDKLKLAADLNRKDLKYIVISEMTCDDIKTINQNEDLGQLGTDVLQALLDRHIRILHA